MAVHQASARPIRKLVAGGASGATLGPALGTLAIFAGEELAGHPLPPGVAASLMAVCVWLALVVTAYLTPASSSDVPVVSNN